MNTIIQKRIEEAAKIYAESEVNRMDDSKYSMNEKKRLKMFDGYDVEEALISFSKQILQKQWISVEEVLPPIREKGIENRSWSDWVLIMTHEGRTFMDFYAFHRKEWMNNGNDVTHWMHIPQLKGGEE